MSRSAAFVHGIARTCAAALVVSFTLSTAASAQAPAASLRLAIERIDAMVAAEHARDAVGSVTVGVVSGADLVWTKSYGSADPDRGLAATRDTVYRIGSITKQITGLMLMQLLHTGALHLSDPVERYLPDVNLVSGRRPGAPPITIVQLATMTAGIAREPDDLPTYLIGPVAQWERTLVSALRETKYEHEPGTRYAYSNIGYAILGAALARAAGVPYTHYVQERILAPLGMAHTAFEPTERIAGAVARGHAIERDGRVDVATPLREHAGRGYKVPNGAVYTTVGDLARFLAFQLGEGPDAVLPRTVLAEHQSRVHSSNGELGSGYGLGFQLARRGEHVFLGHGGSVAGYTAQAWVHRPSRTGIILLRSAEGGKFDLSGLTFGALRELAATAVATTSGAPRGGR